MVALCEVSHEPCDAHLLVCRGLLLWINQEHSLALTVLEQAEMLTPVPDIVYCAMAECYLRCGHRQRARDVLTGLSIDDGLADVTLGPLARGLYAVGDHARSLRVCKLASRRYPEADEPLWWIAQNLAAQDVDAQGRLESARLAALLQAWHLAPGESRYAQALAFLHFDRGNTPEAYRYAQAVTLGDQICSSCLEQLQRIFAAAGDGARLGQCRELMDSAQHVGCDSVGLSAENDGDPSSALFALEEFPQLLDVIDACLVRSAQSASTNAS